MDYKTFLKYLKEALSAPPEPKKVRQIALQGGTLLINPRPVKNFVSSINLIAYCLMPNHFHFLIEQVSDRDINKFMQSVVTRYSMYFNKKYNRVGKLFQGHYKAVLINDENYLLHLSRYIHLNPREFTKNIESAYSSYAEYLGNRHTSWIKPGIILSFFKKANKDFMRVDTYKDFVEKYDEDSTLILGKITLEN